MTDDEIASLLLYINGTYDGTYGAAAKTAAAADTTTAEKPASNNWLYWLLAAFLAGLSYLLFRIIGNLNQLNAAKKECHLTNQHFGLL